MASTAGFRAKLLEEGIDSQVFTIQAIDDTGSVEDSTGVTVELDTSQNLDDGDTRIQLESSATLTISSNTTIEKIRLRRQNYDPSGRDLEAYIEEDIGGTDGEEFPDGGEIEVTEFRVQLSDV